MYCDENGISRFTSMHYRVGGAHFDGRARSAVRIFHGEFLWWTVEHVRTRPVIPSGDPVTFATRPDAVRVVGRLRTTARDGTEVDVVWTVGVLHECPGRVRVDRTVRMTLCTNHHHRITSQHRRAGIEY